MNKPWLGYLGSFLMFLGGIIMVFAGNYIMGGVLIFASIAGAAIKYFLARKKY